MKSAAAAFALIAQTGDRIADFGPYAAAVNNAGLVAFRAQRPNAAGGLFHGAGGPLVEIEVPAGDLIGHPDLNDAGAVSFIAQAPSADPMFWLRQRNDPQARAHSLREIAGMGPRGPVMNEMCEAVFCAQHRSGGEGIYHAVGGRLHAVAVTGERFRAFPGLPVLNHSGHVAFSAVLAHGGQAILLKRGDTLTSVAASGGEFSELGAFPSLSDSGSVAFTGIRPSGAAGAFLWTDGSLRIIADSSGAFESFRSVLLHGAERLILCATPRGGQLGIYRGAGAEAQRVLGLGDPFLDSTVADFALNSVSVNSSGQMALRVRLENGRQLILRAESSAP